MEDGACDEGSWAFLPTSLAVIKLEAENRAPASPPGFDMTVDRNPPADSFGA